MKLLFIKKLEIQFRMNVAKRHHTLAHKIINNNFNKEIRTSVDTKTERVTNIVAKHMSSDWTSVDFDIKYFVWQSWNLKVTVIE